MASSNPKSGASTALLLSLNLLLFSLVPYAEAATATPTCSINSATLSVCANVLGLVNVVVGSPETLPCCSLLNGLTDLEAAVCVCAAIKADILGIINLDINVALSILLNACGRSRPSGFQCS